MSFFLTALAFTLPQEGLLSNEAADLGGPTNRGITQATLDYARNKIPGLPAAVDVLTDAETQTIYQVLFWNEIGGESLPDWAALAVFDGAVNSGPGAATRWLQAALGVTQDGSIGPQTLAALTAAEPRGVLREFNARRLYTMMHQTPTELSAFGLGWARRVMLCHDTAAALIP
jgi:lysozyme family protein